MDHCETCWNPGEICICDPEKDAMQERIAELEAALIRIAALAYSYNAETPDKRFVELGEAARIAAGDAQY